MGEMILNFKFGPLLHDEDFMSVLLSPG